MHFPTFLLHPWSAVATHERVLSKLLLTSSLFGTTILYNLAKSCTLHGEKNLSTLDCHSLVMKKWKWIDWFFVTNNANKEEEKQISVCHRYEVEREEVKLQSVIEAKKKKWSKVLLLSPRGQCFICNGKTYSSKNTYIDTEPFFALRGTHGSTTMGMMAWAASCPCVVFCSFHRPPSTSISLLLLSLLLLLYWCSASAALPFSCIPYTPGRIRIFEAREPLYFREISLSIIRTDRQTALLFCFLSTLSYL